MADVFFSLAELAVALVVACRVTWHPQIVAEVDVPHRVGLFVALVVALGVVLDVVRLLSEQVAGRLRPDEGAATRPGSAEPRAVPPVPSAPRAPLR